MVERMSEGRENMEHERGHETRGASGSSGIPTRWEGRRLAELGQIWQMQAGANKREIDEMAELAIKIGNYIARNA